MSGTSASEPVAEARVVRILGGAVGAGALAFGALALPLVVDQSTTILLLTVSFPLVIGSLVAVGIVALRGNLWATRRAAAVAAAMFLLALVLDATVLPEPIPDAGQLPWLLSLTAVPATAAAMVLPNLLAWVYLVLTSLLTVLVRWQATDGDLPLAVDNAAFSLLICGIFVGLTLLVRLGGLRLDALNLAARVEASERAAEVARRRESARIDALLHDGVLATLLVAARGGTPTDMLAAEAAAGLRALGAIALDPDETAPEPARAASMTADDALAEWRAVRDETAPDAVFDVDRTAGSLDVLPSAVVSALGRALGEALRNAVRHTPPGTRRRVAVRMGVRDVRVTATDDGEGFRAADVPPDRLGMRLSIVGRMSDLPGGSTSIDSSPGAGTVVNLRWERP